MHLASDYIHPTPHGGHCRVRIFEPDDPELDSRMVILTELGDNLGMSVTNAAERIAADVIHANRLPVPVVFIEHYEDGARGTTADPATFDLVTFSSYEVEDLGAYMGEERRRIGAPSWSALDRATVEALVGRRL